jgi:Acyl-CoA synthetases (AMP-forming)/AMP-acid ligases II
MFHVFAAYPILMTCILSGAHMVMPTPQGYRGDGVFKNFWKLIERWKVTFLVMVPTAATQLMQHRVDADVSTLRYALCGSSPLPVELFKRFQDATGVEIIEGYGMTEATCLISVNPPDGEKKIGSVGLPYPYTEIKILVCNDNGSIQKECGVDEIGEVCVYNPGVTLNGTYTDDAKNKGLYPDDRFMRTGDLGRIDKDGYLWLTGRAKDIIIRGGHNIDPSLIEDAIAGHKDIAAVGAIGQPDPKAGEVPCVYVQLIDGCRTSAEAIANFANEAIGEQAAKPKHVRC